MQLSRIKVNPLRGYQHFRFNPYTRTSRSITLKPTELLITLEDQRVHDHMQIQGRVLDKYDPRTNKVVVHYAPTSGYAWYTLWATRNCLFLQWASMSIGKKKQEEARRSVIMHVLFEGHAVNKMRWEEVNSKALESTIYTVAT